MSKLSRVPALLVGAAVNAALAIWPAAAQSATGSRPISIETIETIPKGAGPFPVVVLAPGAGSDMRQPFAERLAKALVARHIAVIRFNRSYFTANPKGHASPCLTDEIDDMKAAIISAATRRSMGRA